MQHEVVPDRLEPLERLGRGAPHHAVHLVALVQQQLGKVGAVLAGDAGDEGGSRHGSDRLVGPESGRWVNSGGRGRRQSAVPTNAAVPTIAARIAGIVRDAPRPRPRPSAAGTADRPSHPSGGSTRCPRRASATTNTAARTSSPIAGGGRGGAGRIVAGARARPDRQREREADCVHDDQGPLPVDGDEGLSKLSALPHG